MVAGAREQSNGIVSCCGDENPGNGILAQVLFGRFDNGNRVLLDSFLLYMQQRLSPTDAAEDEFDFVGGQQPESSGTVVDEDGFIYVADPRQQGRAELQSLCERYRVQSLELFGSATKTKRFDNSESDLDFLVEFFPLGPGEKADAYFGLLEGLEKLFRRPIDLVVTRAIKNRFFREAIERDRTLLYAA